MPVLEWGAPGEKQFESGLDRGVLYFGLSAYPWNGLIEVSESVERSTEQIFLHGAHIGTKTSVGAFSGKIKAYTYPDVFDYFTGDLPIDRGVFVGDQYPKPFSMSYRTRVGDDVDGEEKGYKIHVIYNIIATPSDTTRQSISESTDAVEFEWDLLSTPEPTRVGLRPSSHLVINTNELDPLLLMELEALLYGSAITSPVLLPLPLLVDYITQWYRISIIDNGDGTWTAMSDFPEYITDHGDGTFTIEGANAVYVDNNTYTITGTKSLKDIPTVKINDNGDGTWTATTANDSLIQDLGNGTFTLDGAEVVYLTADSYSVSDTEF